MIPGSYEGKKSLHSLDFHMQPAYTYTLIEVKKEKVLFTSFYIKHPDF